MLATDLNRLALQAAKKAGLDGPGVVNSRSQNGGRTHLNFGLSIDGSPILVHINDHDANGHSDEWVVNLIAKKITHAMASHDVSRTRAWFEPSKPFKGLEHLTQEVFEPSADIQKGLEEGLKDCWQHRWDPDAPFRMAGPEKPATAAAPEPPSWLLCLEADGCDCSYCATRANETGRSLIDNHLSLLARDDRIAALVTELKPAFDTLIAGREEAVQAIYRILGHRPVHNLEKP